MGKEWTEDDVKSILDNPIYTGMGPFPRMITDDLYVTSALKSIKVRGAEEYLRSMLKCLKDSLGTNEGG